MNFIEGEILLLYKPYRWSSFDLVKKIRNLLAKKLNEDIKIGHAGTLDPLAEGLMILCTGKKTKEMTNFLADDKEYIAQIKIGATTPSFDLETIIDSEYPTDHITKEYFENILATFIGNQKQTPPTYSAKKINGQRAYKKARKGQKINMTPVDIKINELEIISFDMPFVEIRISCSKGTYIRTFAYDLGRALQSGAHLIGLKRIRCGSFKLSNAHSIEEFEKLLNTI